MPGFLGVAWFKFTSRAKNKVVLITGTNEIATLAATHFALAGYCILNRTSGFNWCSGFLISILRFSAKVVIGDANGPEGERISQSIRESGQYVTYISYA